MPPSKLHPKSSQTFLSGEADPEMQCRRQDRLGKMLSPMSGRPGRPEPDDCNVTSLKVGNASSARKVCIEIIGETVDDKRAETSESGDDSDGGPPPISLSNHSDSVADATDCPGGSPGPATKAKAQNTNDGAEVPSLMEEMMAEAAKAREKKEKEAEAAERKDARTASFGMKKGFLSSKPKNKSRSKTRNAASSAKSTVGGEKGETKSTSQHKQAVSGFRKGFLDNPWKKESAPTSTRAATKENKTQDDDDVFEIDSEGNLIKSLEPTVEDIPTIRPKTSSDKTDRLRLEEVQEAMKNNPLEKLTGGEWVTDDLMQKVSENPRLAAGMGNPKFAAALQALQEDPRQAMIKFKDHPEVIEYLNEFCGVMGEHFTKLGTEQERRTKGMVEQVEQHDIGPLAEAALQKQAELKAQQGKAVPDTGMSKAEDEEQLLVDSILSDKELTAILMDPGMQVVMQECAAPGRMRVFIEHPEFGPKLRKLMLAGLLKVEG